MKHLPCWEWCINLSSKCHRPFNIIFVCGRYAVREFGFWHLLCPRDFYTWQCYRAAYLPILFYLKYKWKNHIGTYSYAIKNFMINQLWLIWRHCCDYEMMSISYIVLFGVSILLTFQIDWKDQSRTKIHTQFICMHLSSSAAPGLARIYRSKMFLKKNL